MTAVELMIDVIGQYNIQAEIWNNIKKEFDEMMKPIEPLLAEGLVDDETKAGWLNTATKLIELGKALLALQTSIMKLTTCRWPNGEVVHLKIELSDEEIMSLACFPLIAVGSHKESIWIQ